MKPDLSAYTLCRKDELPPTPTLCHKVESSSGGRKKKKKKDSERLPWLQVT